MSLALCSLGHPEDTFDEQDITTNQQGDYMYIKIYCSCICACFLVCTRLHTSVVDVKKTSYQEHLAL